MTYSLIDSGNQQKLEQFGDLLLIRPCSQAVWLPSLPEEEWDRADAFFSREESNRWQSKKRLPSSWNVSHSDILFKLSMTDFGHLGIFPEHHFLWEHAVQKIKAAKRPLNVLNLFAYSGGATLACAKAGAKVCHLDASKGMVSWARENAAINQLEKAPIRWIVDDVFKFLGREVKRGVRYDGMIIDPPSFGRGSQGEVFKIENDLGPLLALCREVLVENPLFVLLSTHTPGMTPLVMEHMMQQMMRGLKGKIDSGEMLLSAKKSVPLPSGCYARWSDEG